MKIAITGGTGFIGRHLARFLVDMGHEVVLISRGIDQRDMDIHHLKNTTFFPIGIGKEAQLLEAFKGVDTVAHCAGINREIGQQTYKKVHVEGTRNVINAAKKTNIKKVLLLSFLRARPNCHSLYHESKWEAEEIIRTADLNYTILKAGIIYGKGDHMLDHLSHTIHTIPLFASVGLKDMPIRPVAIKDLTRIIMASLVENQLSCQTVAVVGPEEIKFSEAVKRIAKVLNKRIGVFPLPVWIHYILAGIVERTMKIPLISSAQVRMLAEGIIKPSQPCESLPGNISPKTLFNEEQIRQGLPEPRSFGFKDCLCFN